MQVRSAGQTAASHDAPRVLVLSKRQYMGRDLLDDRYGRFRELPLALSALGAQAQGICLSYRRRPEGVIDDITPSGSMSWSALNVSRLMPAGKRSYWRAVDRIGESLRPDVVWACSDVPHAVLGAAVARRLRTKLAIDLYDNFESYPLSRIPGVNRALRLAVNSADGVTCISSPLARLVREKYGYRGNVEVLENAIPTGIFRPFDKAACRAQFGLPGHALLIGTAGALSRTRGIEYLIEAFLKLARDRDDVHLVLAGVLDPGLHLPSMERIHYLGLLEPDAVPKLLSALDISVVCNRDSAFGRYCFPQKLYESIACEVPVAVAAVGAVAELLRAYPENLYAPDNVDSLVAVLQGLCRRPVVPALEVRTWPFLGARLLDFLRRITDSRS